MHDSVMAMNSIASLRNWMVERTRGKASTNFAFQGWDGDYCRGNSTTIITRRGYRNEGLRAAQ